SCTEQHCDVKKDQCVFTYKDGIPTPGGADQKGNCRARRRVAGADLEVVDSTDLPKASGDCVTIKCNEGSPDLKPVKIGEKCDTKNGKLCDGQGNCVECNDPSDCKDLPEDDACQTRACDNNKCVQRFVQSSFEVPGSQIPGDCKRVVCDGHGKQ